MRRHGHERAAVLWVRPGCQGRVSCVPAAYLLLSMCFSLTCLWFPSVVFKLLSETGSALCFQVTEIEQVKQTYAGAFKSCVWWHFPEWARASRSLFQQIQQERVCSVSLGFVFDIFIENAKMQYHSLRVGKMQNCVSLLSVRLLKKHVFKIFVRSGFLFCITASGHVVLTTCSAPDAQLPETQGREALESRQDFRSPSAILHH